MILYDLSAISIVILPFSSFCISFSPSLSRLPSPLSPFTSLIPCYSALLLFYHQSNPFFLPEFYCYSRLYVHICNVGAKTWAEKEPWDVCVFLATRSDLFFLFANSPLNYLTRLPPLCVCSLNSFSSFMKFLIFSILCLWFMFIILIREYFCKIGRFFEGKYNLGFSHCFHFCIEIWECGFLLFVLWMMWAQHTWTKYRMRCGPGWASSRIWHWCNDIGGHGDPV